MIDESTEIMVIPFITFILTSVDANHPQMVTRKDKAMSLVLRRYERVDKAYKQQASDTADHEVNAIVRCGMDSRVDNSCACNN